ncbi:ATP-binding protein [Streptomyces poonensis]|uniref:Uncharacterized protein n=1 Tax=Streptomyces poonensis TaxID=68255 RepID=A0A918PMU2_9ACTN|nr:AAA family ATPase [Streptomyces poonensis]GGZ15079.1 hypothetical protein GCM10010365_38440 [Streptomyces poonensis]GLJ91448.1 hypothetical protein GCM10017589_40550 [Streptomyces poonensis]
MAAERRLGNLPKETNQLVGRRSELDQVARLCGRSRLVTVTGVGGVGKTRLARRVAGELQPGFADGAWWVELSPLSAGMEALPYAIAETLPLADQTTRPMLEVVAEYLAGRQALLVWDTCEHLAEDCREMAATLLTVAPGLRILATSRCPLDLACEEMLALDPLPVPGADDDEAADSVLLLADRAAQAVPGFTVTDANRAELAALCRRLEGLPLALELAAARLREIPLPELNRRLDDRYAILGTTDGPDYDADPPWHQALRTAIGWSHQLCTPAERLLWARLSVFADTFDAEAARQVCADAQLPGEEVPALLAALVEKSILTWVPTGGGERYRMLDTIREFGAFWLRGLGEEQAARRRHRDHYLTLAHEADAAWSGPGQTASKDRMSAEYANLRAALDFCLAEKDGRTALEMGGALGFLWYACGFARDGRHYLEQALALEQASSPARAKALWAASLVALVQGDTEAGSRLATAFQQAVAEEADATTAVAVLTLEGASLTVSGRHTQAAKVLADLPPAPPADGRYHAAWVMARNTQALVHNHLGQFTDALATADDLCAECARRGETWSRAWGDYMRALAALGLGRASEAAAHARTALAGKQRLHDDMGIAMTTDLLASAAIASGRTEQAARLLGLAEQVWHTVGTPQAGIPELVAARTACEKQARHLIGDATYQTAFDAGYDTDLDTGIAEALTPPGPSPHAPLRPGPTG